MSFFHLLAHMIVAIKMIWPLLCTVLYSTQVDSESNTINRMYILYNAVVMRSRLFTTNITFDIKYHEIEKYLIANVFLFSVAQRLLQRPK